MILSVFSLCTVMLAVGAYAANVDVTITSGVAAGGNVDKTATFETDKKITLTDSIPDCTMLGFMGKRDLGSNLVNVKGVSVFKISAINGGSIPVQRVCTSISAYHIFKTTVEGIGISYNNEDGQNIGGAIPYWSGGGGADAGGLIKWYATGNYTTGIVQGIGNHISIRLWKIPSSPTASYPYGAITIDGPWLLTSVGPRNSGDTVTCNTMKTGDYCYMTRFTSIKTTTSIHAGTCEFITKKITVDLGKRLFLTSTPQYTGSKWVDASFKIKCPNAYGYYSNPASSSIATKNKSVVLKIIPRTTVIDNNRGIIGLDSDTNSATGVGVQLAWGEHSTQNTATPVNPVKFNTTIVGNTASSNILAGDYSIGVNLIQGDGTIKMAARFIRTTGNVSGGIGKAGVEILVNYQ